MKIKEARQAYTAQLDILRNRQRELLKQKEEHEKSAASDGGGVVLELSEEYRERAKELQEKLDSIKEQIEEREKLRDQVIETEVGIINAESAKQQGEAMQEYGEEMAKCLEIARRISHGDRVPATDEQKLMEFNMEIYMAAKNMAVMNMDKKHKDYDSLWDDEEDESGGENPDPMEMAGDTEIQVEIPELNLEEDSEG
ncbi:MAG: hypothetical protein NC311_18540 [Muribaculaceae bacterium]|nr:hypothetical protein [Muribaculaceae bacterium]